jgi:palmitoyl-protein thioesterase
MANGRWLVSVYFFFVVVLIFGSVLQLASAWTPVVLMHGSASSTATVMHTRNLLEKAMPGVYVKPIEIGNGIIDSLFWPMDDQLDAFCAEMKADPKLADGVNILGFSQGGLLIRAYVERCNSPPVKNLVSYLGPQMGVYGVPRICWVPYINTTLDTLVGTFIYSEWAQHLFSFAGYWRDPYQLQTYHKRCEFLPDINNEGPEKNPTYKDNMLTLQNFAMIYSEVDQTVDPRESSVFGSYAPNDDTKVLALEDLDLYKEDWIGLRELQETGRLHRFGIPCYHGDYYSACYGVALTNYVLPFLMDTWNGTVVPSQHHHADSALDESSTTSSHGRVLDMVLPPYAAMTRE